jgi:Na+/melibiose symporter-like transporter
MLRAFGSARAWGRSVQLWLLTVLGGTLCFLPFSFGSGAGPVFLLIGFIALAASAPVVLLCVPLFGGVARLSTLPQRWWLATSGIVLLFWAAVQVAEAVIGNDSDRLVLLFALPYLVAAFVATLLVYPDLLRRPGPVPQEEQETQPPLPLDVRRLLLFWLLQEVLVWVLLPLLRGRMPFDEQTRRYLLSGDNLLQALAPWVLTLPLVGYLLAWAGGQLRRSQRLLRVAGGFAALALLDVLTSILPVLPVPNLGLPDASWFAQSWLTGTAIPLVTALAVFRPLLLRPDDEPVAAEVE